MAREERRMGMLFVVELMTAIDAQRWNQVKEILGEAMERPPDVRNAYLAEACGGDAALEAEVRRLLEHDQEASSFLDQGALGRSPAEDDLAGQDLGRYRILEEIGRGGMGTVYLAERVDGAYHQRVAVKAIRRGMDTEPVLRRFRTERQILASLSHPNIARLLDGGALPDGRPYFVMEYVEGRRVDRYCAEENLSPAEILQLFLRVCDAVSFAHQRLVVHRDIKPGNVLVEANGTPKLLDFGIAKLLGSDVDGDAPATETLVRPMTPEYASPEQILGQPVSTVTDVYALGGMLYELLTGQRPHPTENRSTQAVLAAIRDTDPVPPSVAAPASLRRRIQGDLDVILLTALRREPERRYPSVEAFAADVRRHLDGQPVAARRDSWTYRASRFLSRNAVPVTAAVLVAGALVTGTLVAMSQARVARAERALAEKRQHDTLRLTNSMLFELFEGIDQGPARARQMLVERAFGYLDQLSREGVDDVNLLHELALAYRRLGNVQGGTREMGGRDVRQAMESFTKALRLRERLSILAPEHFENRRDLGVLYVELGALANIEGRVDSSVANHRKGLALLESAVAERPRDQEARTKLIQAHLNIATALGSSDAIANVGRPSEAAPHLAAAIRMNEALLAERPDDVNVRAFMVVLYNEHAICLEKLGRPAEARESQMKAMRTIESLVERHPDSLNYRRELAVAYGNFAATLLRTDKAAALEYTRKALPLYESIAQATPGDSDAERDLAIGHRNVGKALTGNGDAAAALPHLRRAVSLLEPLTIKYPDNALMARQLAFTHMVMADALLASGEPVRSLTETAAGIRICETLLKKDASNMTALRTLALSYAQAGRAAEALAARQPAKWAEARSLYVRSRESWSKLEKAGEIAATNVPQVEQVHEAIARCEAAVARK